MSQHLGSNFDDFLEEEGCLAQTEAISWTRVITFQITQLMAEQNLSRTAMAERMCMSPATIEALLDMQNGSTTVQMLEQAALVLGKRLRIELV